MSINPNCKHYRLKPLKDDVLRSTLSASHVVNTHLCLHPKNEEGMGQLECNTSNDFCPHKKKNR